MGFYGEQILPRVIDRTCGLAELAPLRARVAAGLHGTVLEIGFGSGLNLPHLPADVERLLAVDPSEVGWRLAAERLATSPVPVELVGLDGERLEVPDDSVDAALCTFTLCTIPDVHRALREVHRVLRPGGRLHLLEHGLSTDAKVAAWQHRLTPLQRRLFGGCHFDRPIAGLVAAAGFDVGDLHGELLKGPKTVGTLTLGSAMAG